MVFAGETGDIANVGQNPAAIAGDSEKLRHQAT
jgi:hypothetical protein